MGTSKTSNKFQTHGFQGRLCDADSLTMRWFLLPSFVAFSAFPKCLARDETQSGELGENKEVERNSENPHVLARGEKIYSKHTLRLCDQRQLTLGCKFVNYFKT